MADRKGRFHWPGVQSPVEGLYTISHGISPGTAVLKCLPQSGNFAETGDLIITDDFGTIVVPGCKVDKVREEYDETGLVWILEILDWRWKWRDLGAISGCYNQLDEHAKLIPWTIRSPYELAVECLNALGVQNYTIDMPPGLTKADGEQHLSLNPPWIGVIPITGTNPPINWVAEPPALALDELCQRFGRVIVPRLSDYTVTIVKPGFGNLLPPGSIAKRAPALDTPETPLGVAVIGDPTKYQVRLKLEAVAEEWDGSYRPINSVSYAPLIPARVQKSVIKCGRPAASDVFVVTLNGVGYEYTASAGDTGATVVADLVTQINGGADSTKLTAAAGGLGNKELTITGNDVEYHFAVEVSSGPSQTFFKIIDSDFASNGEASWERTPVPTFADVGVLGRTDFNEVTDRLTYTQALDLAQRSVFRCYRISDVDVSVKHDNIENPVKNPKPINVAGYGTLQRRQQIVLLDTQVEQVTPQAVDLTLVDQNNLPAIVNFYNGYSRDKPAAVYGAVSNYLNHQLHHTEVDENSPADEQVHIPFRIDPVRQLVIFNSPVFRTRGIRAPGANQPLNLNGARIFPAQLVLETGVNIRNAETNELERYKAVQLNANASGLTNLLVRHYPDVQLNVIGLYDNRTDNNAVGSTLLELDAIERANHYLTGMKIQYFATAAEILEYNGIMAINLDGAIRQVTWEFSENGCVTTASRNTEHSIYVPPYKARRRAEFLDAAARVMVENANPQRLREGIFERGPAQRPQRGQQIVGGTPPF